MPHYEIAYKPRPLQLEVHRAMDKVRFSVAVCHRRFGKTVLAVNELIKRAMMCRGDKPRLAYVGPTYRQAKQTAWDYICHYSMAIPGIKVNQAELRVDYPNGAQLRIYGADNPDSLRGIYLDGVVLDEFGMQQPKTWGEVIRPALADRKGWAIFLGTPNGKNQFYDLAEYAKVTPDWGYFEFPASRTGYVDHAELETAKRVMTEDEYAQEFECSFAASVRGAVYAREIEAARASGRITKVPYDPILPVDTDWDLGVLDPTAIIFSQSTRSGEIRLIDYYEATGEGLPHYISVLAGKGYVYGSHWAPHDIQVREMVSGRSRQETAAGLGLMFRLTPRTMGTSRGEVEEGIHAGRLLMARCWFDEERCRPLVEALMSYRREYNQRLNEFKDTVVHDWASHGSDAFRGLAVRHKTPEERARVILPRMEKHFAWG